MHTPGGTRARLAHIGPLIIVLTILGNPMSASAQNRDEQSLLASMLAHIQAIRTKVPRDDRTLSLCNQLDQLIGRLKETHAQLSESDGSEIYSITTTGSRTTNASNPQRRETLTTTLGTSYVSSLQSNDDLLSGLLDESIADADRRETLEVVKEDLQIKLKFLSRGNFVREFAKIASDGFMTITQRAGEVLVKAQTLSGTQDVAGYRVYFSPQGWIKDPNHHVAFSSLSSPTREEYLAPGPYFIWATRGSTTTDRALIRIGTQGPRQIIQIAVPSN